MAYIKDFNLIEGSFSIISQLEHKDLENIEVIVKSREIDFN